MVMHALDSTVSALRVSQAAQAPNVLDPSDPPSRLSSAECSAADHYDGDAYYDRQSMHDSCAIGALCFLAMLIIGFIGVALHALGLSVA